MLFRDILGLVWALIVTVLAAVATLRLNQKGFIRQHPVYHGIVIGLIWFAAWTSVSILYAALIPLLEEQLIGFFVSEGIAVAAAIVFGVIAGLAMAHRTPQ